MEKSIQKSGKKYLDRNDDKQCQGIYTYTSQEVISVCNALQSA